MNESTGKTQGPWERLLDMAQRTRGIAEELNEYASMKITNLVGSVPLKGCDAKAVPAPECLVERVLTELRETQDAILRTREEINRI